MSHETREGRKIGDDIRHNHFEAAHKEISHEMHAHPKEFEKTLKSINKDLAKHHENPLSVERDSKNQISHINFNNHDIYSNPRAEAEKKGADMPKAAAPDASRTAPAEVPRAGAPDTAKPAQGDTTGDARNPERDGRDREEREREGHEGRHHKHHHKHGGRHGHGGHGEGGGGEDNDSEAPQDNTDPKNGVKPGDADSNAKPGDPKDPANKDAAGSPRDPAAKATDGSATAPGADGLRGRDNAEKAMNYFMDKGLSKEQAAGIVGNLDHEAPGVNPGQHQHGGPGYGIAQWEGSRKKEEKQFAKDHGKPADDLKTQLDFAWHELNTSHRGALRAVERAHTPSQAARAFERGFEGASKPHMKARIQNALYAYNRPSGDIDGEVLATSR